MKELFILCAAVLVTAALINSTKADDNLPALLLDAHELTSNCESLQSIEGAEPIAAEISDVARLYALPCSNSSHDGATWRVYLFETGEIGGIRPLLFALFTPEFGWVGSDLLRGVEIDAATATITHKSLDRWGGACGGFGRWQWNDYTLKLDQFRYRKSCKQSKNPASWTQSYP